MYFYSHKAVFHIDRFLRKMLIIFIERGDGHCIQWQHRTERAILGWEISPYLVERQTGWAVTARPANAVWWQAHEITSGFSQSHSPSGKTGGKYASPFTSYKHTQTSTAMHTPSVLVCLFSTSIHACVGYMHLWLKWLDNNTPRWWLQLGVSWKTKHTRHSGFPCVSVCSWKTQQG